MISRIFIVRPIATSLLMLAIFLCGLLSYRFLPISALPEIDYPTIQVSTGYPGASPQVIEASVTAPLERQLGQMAGLSHMFSTSSNGLSLITLQFILNLNLDIAEQEVQAAINSALAYLPTLPNPPIYSKVNPADTPVITLALTSDTIDLSVVEDFAETRLTQKLSQIAGVGLVTISGGQRPAVRIKVNHQLLTSYNLSTNDIRNTVDAANIAGAKGNFDGPFISYTINANDRLLSAKDYQDLIISYQNNATIKLKDVAAVTDGVENMKQAAWVNSKPALIINIQKQPGANIIKVADNIKDLLPKFAATIPSGINLTILSDRSSNIKDSIKNVRHELFLAIILVVFVMFCFFRNIPATIIPAIAMIISIVGTFSIMYLLGFSINNLTLMALTIATGFVVDDAIVMIENIIRYIEEGEKPVTAALKGAEQISFTIISLTISLIAVLIPLFFMEDIVGRLFREFAITLAATIVLSGIVSLTLTPMLCSRMLGHGSISGHNIFTKWLEDRLDWTIHNYGLSLKYILNHQGAVLIIAFITLIITLLLFHLIPKGFFPVQDTGIIQAISEMRQDITFDDMAVQQQRLADIVLEDKAVDSLSSYIGVDGSNVTNNSGRMLINLKDLDLRSNVKDVIERMHQKLVKIPSAKLYLHPVQDLSIDSLTSRGSYRYSISSHDVSEVNHYSTLLIQKFNQAPQLKNVVLEEQNEGIATYIEINRDTASKLGVTVNQVVNTLYDLFGQRQITNTLTERNQYHVVIEGNIKSLDDVYIKSSNNKMVPLKVVATISEGKSPLVIAHQDQFPVANISFDLKDNCSLGAAVNTINKIADELKIPNYMAKGFLGTALGFADSGTNEVWLIIAAIIVVYIVLGVLYESYIHPITILSTLPSACMGALIALIICGKDMDVISIIGIILLIGIVKKNAIMMIDFAIEQQRISGNNPSEAIYKACILRFRPILMTTLATLFGAVPLVSFQVIGSEIRSPLGITIIGGLMLSQLLTLYTTPVIYLAFEQLTKKFSNGLR